MAHKVLIVDDEPNITSSFKSLLADHGIDSNTAASGEEALEKLKKTGVSLILLDLNLPGISGIDLLTRLKETPDAPLVMVISGQSDIPIALKAIKLGAIDYLEKPVPPEKLVSSVNSALMLADLNRQRNLMVEDLDSRSRITGTSKSVRTLLATLAKVAPSESTVLITGENGTGKELAATRIYLQSRRRDKPFVKVNCPGIPESLFESELFGHIKGSFTGAVKDYPGKFKLADTGTIFLDEIGDLPPACQAKLLRVLESGEIETLGAADRQQVDVRIICATNQDLRKAVADGRFREDLYYRVSVLTVEVPPLRRRLEDIPQLVGEFLRRFNPAGTTRVSPEAVAFLTSLDYPGNVRQLKNIIERLTILCPDSIIGPDDVRTHTASGSVGYEKKEEATPLSDKLRQFEKELIRQTLLDHKGNISAAARALAVDRANLSRKIKELGLKSD